jgi:large subunit ribosomal protein L25
MERAQLEASLRTAVGSNAVSKVRNAGFVPGVVYGKNVPGGKLEVQVPLLDLTKLMAVHGNALLDLKVANHGLITVVIQEAQRDAIKRHPIHVDFKQVNLNEKITVNVAIHFVGTAKGVKEGGVIELLTREISINCLPTDLPEVLEVNVAELGLGEKLTAGSVKLPANVQLVGDPEQVVVMVAEVVEKENGEETAAAEPEVIREKKPETKA